MEHIQCLCTFFISKKGITCANLLYGGNLSVGKPQGTSYLQNTFWEMLLWYLTNKMMLVVSLSEINIPDIKVSYFSKGTMSRMAIAFC